METEAWIRLLATNAGPAPRIVAARRLVPVALIGVTISAMVAVAVGGFLPMQTFATAAPWIKLVYAGSLALAAAWLTSRLAVPVARTTPAARAVAAVALAMFLLGALVLLITPRGERLAALLGESWLECPWNVLGLSLPGLIASLWAVRSLAPTRPRAAGFAAGVFAGSLGAFGYSFSCPEASAAFVAVWYSLGILLTGGLGALLGPRALRW